MALVGLPAAGASAAEVPVPANGRSPVAFGSADAGADGDAPAVRGFTPAGDGVPRPAADPPPRPVKYETRAVMSSPLTATATMPAAVILAVGALSSAVS